MLPESRIKHVLLLRFLLIRVNTGLIYYKLECKDGLKNKATNTLSPRTLFWLWCVYMAHEQQMAHISPALSRDWAFVPPWPQSLYPGLEEWCAKRPQRGDDSLFYIGVCCKSLAIHVVLKGPKEIKKTLGPIPPTRLVTTYGAAARRLWTTCLQPSDWTS